MSEKKRPSPTVHLIGGLLAGVVSTAVTHPLDLIKVRYQVKAGKELAYRSVTDAVTTIIRTEGLAGLYQGLTPALIGSAPSWGGYFFFYERAKARYSGPARRKLSTLQHLVAAVEASTIMVIITNPVWLIKTRLQIQRKQLMDGSTSVTRPYKGFFDAARTIVREEGPLALYKGLGPALVLVSHGAVQFVVYEYLKEHMKAKTSWDYLFMGAASKMVASIVTYPYQVVKARLQSQRARAAEALSGKEAEALYHGTVDCFRKIVREEGLRGLFKGCFPNAVRVAPAAAVTFFTYENIVKALG